MRMKMGSMWGLSILGSPVNSQLLEQAEVIDPFVLSHTIFHEHEEYMFD